MVGNRPVVGVRNPVSSASPNSFLRAKNDGTGAPASGGKPNPGNQNPGVRKPGVKKQRVSPVRLLEAALQF